VLDVVGVIDHLVKPGELLGGEDEERTSEKKGEVGTAGRVYWSGNPAEYPSL